jgi:hypothetical protein
MPHTPIYLLTRHQGNDTIVDMQALTFFAVAIKNPMHRASGGSLGLGVC